MSYKIVSKFIKDISFEIPTAQAFVMLEKDISKYNLHFDIKSKPFKGNIIEVNTILKILPTAEIKNKILAEINLTSLVTIDKNLTDKKGLEKIILIQVPNEVYPTLYETLIYLFKQAGIENLRIDREVNFEKMYKERAKS